VHTTDILDIKKHNVWRCVVSLQPLGFLVFSTMLLRWLTGVRAFVTRASCIGLWWEWHWSNRIRSSWSYKKQLSRRRSLFCSVLPASSSQVSQCVLTTDSQTSNSLPLHLWSPSISH